MADALAAALAARNKKVAHSGKLSLAEDEMWATH